MDATPKVEADVHDASVALTPRTPVALRNGFPVFQTPPEAPLFGLEDVDAAENGLDDH